VQIRHDPCATRVPRSDKLRRMDPSPRHGAAERRFRQLLVENGLEAPDRVEYDREELVFFWDEQKLAVVVELDDTEQRSMARAHASPGGAQPAGAVDGDDADGAAADRRRERDADSTVVREPGAAGDHAALAGDRDPCRADA
jgi:hypothetical protein